MSLSQCGPLVAVWRGVQQTLFLFSKQPHKSEDCKRLGSSAFRSAASAEPHTKRCPVAGAQDVHSLRSQAYDRELVIGELVNRNCSVEQCVERP